VASRGAAPDGRLDAVRHAAATSGAGPPAGTPDFNAPAMAGRVLSELADTQGGVTLVIDDLHELTSPDALAQLARLLTSLPPQVHAILTTRHDVRLGLHQLRLAGELAEIRAADLRFTERETRELLDASGIALSEAGAALLRQRTEGWALGLEDAERHLREGAVLAREIGRPLPGSRLPRAAGVRVEDPSVRHHSGALPRGHNARRAVRLGHGAHRRTRAEHAGRHDGLDRRVRRRRERWLRRAERALQTDTGPGMGLLMHIASGLLHACHDRLHEAFDRSAPLDVRHALGFLPRLVRLV
jgi:hypothetical protein